METREEAHRTSTFLKTRVFFDEQTWMLGMVGGARADSVVVDERQANAAEQRAPLFWESRALRSDEAGGFRSAARALPTGGWTMGFPARARASSAR